MKELVPLIEGCDAKRYLSSVPDNGRTLIIVGDHPDKWHDAAWAKGIVGEHDNMAINAAADGAAMDYCAILHSYNIGLPEFPESTIHPSTHVVGLRCGRESKRVDQTIAAEPVGGTSALFAVIAGLVLGYKRLYLCGVRLEPGSIYYDEHVVQNWKRWKPVLSPALTVIAPAGCWLKELYHERT